MKQQEAGTRWKKMTANIKTWDFLKMCFSEWVTALLSVLHWNIAWYKEAAWVIQVWKSWCFYCKYCIFNLHSENHHQTACFTKDGHRFRTTGGLPTWDCSIGWANLTSRTRLLRVNLLWDRRQNGVWFTKRQLPLCRAGALLAKLQNWNSTLLDPDLNHSQHCMSKSSFKHGGKNIALWSPAYEDMLLFRICSIARNSLSDLLTNLGWSPTSLHRTDSSEQNDVPEPSRSSV